MYVYVSNNMYNMYDMYDMYFMYYTYYMIYMSDVKNFRKQDIFLKSGNPFVEFLGHLTCEGWILLRSRLEMGTCSMFFRWRYPPKTNMTLENPEN